MRVTIICPTYIATDKLQQFVQSAMMYHFIQPFKLIIVNNGKAPLEKIYNGHENIQVLTMKENLGWEGGLKEGLKYVDTEYVMFANDDIFIPRSSSTWLKNMVRMLDSYKDVGAVGPSSNCVMGPQNIFNEPYVQSFRAQFLIGFCVLFRKSALDDIGGVDDKLPGGDDLDYSIRLREKGWGMAVLKDVFVYHHGFQTGNKVHGDHTVNGGWNSPAMTERTNTALIKKHGMLNWWKTVVPQPVEVGEAEQDTEGNVIRSIVKGEKVCEIGCGGQKTVVPSIGVDRVKAGGLIPHVNQVSVADVVSDVTERLPFGDGEFDVVIARHILEHCLDTIETLTEWARIIKKGGQLIIAVPNERITDGIPLNPEHCHAFTPDSLSKIGKAVGLKAARIEQGYNSVSFVILFEKETA